MGNYSTLEFPCRGYPPEITTPDTTSVITLKPSIQGNIGWRIQGNWSARNQFKANPGLDLSLSQIGWAPVASELSFNITLDAGLQANYAGSASDNKFYTPVIITYVLTPNMSCTGFNKLIFLCKSKVLSVHLNTD